MRAATSAAVALCFFALAYAAEPECEHCDCDNCKCRESKAGKGCALDSASNTCTDRQEDDNSLCKTNASDTTQQYYECKFPVDLTSNVGTSQAASILQPVTLRSGQWQFFNAQVEMGTPMHHIQYSLSIPNSSPNSTKVAFLVGRCLKEVECGACPPRCEVLQSPERTPQFCTIDDYCPAFDGALVAAAANASNVEYKGSWKNLKKCQKEKANFYIGLYTMQTNAPSNNESVSAELKLWWDGTSAGAVQLPSMILLIAVVLMSAI